MVEHRPLAVASLNIRGMPVTGSQLTARCKAIGDIFDASSMDVVCLQEVLTYRHLNLIARAMRSFPHVSLSRSLAGPAGGLVTFSRKLATSSYHRFPLTPLAGAPLLAALAAALKGMLVARLPDGTCVVNVHPVANRDGDWSPGNRFVVLPQEQLSAIADKARSIAERSPVIARGDFNVACDSSLWQEFMIGSGLSDAFAGKCPPTFRTEYLPPGRTPHCIDFILAGDEVHVSDSKVIMDDARGLPGGVCYLSDHVGLSVRANLAPA